MNCLISHREQYSIAWVACLPDIDVSPGRLSNRFRVAYNTWFSLYAEKSVGRLSLKNSRGILVNSPPAAWRPVYLRLSVTDRCNLRCKYCRPAVNGGHFSNTALASDKELLDLVGLLDEEFPIYK